LKDVRDLSNGKKSSSAIVEKSIDDNYIDDHSDSNQSRSDKQDNGSVGGKGLSRTNQ
jgi:hypothetical protein